MPAIALLALGCSRVKDDKPHPVGASTAAVVELGKPATAQDPGSTDPDWACRWSFEQTKRMVAENGGPIPMPPPFPPVTTPTLGVFMQDCLRLPREVQKCLVTDYAVMNAESCNKARNAYDAENARRYKKLIQ